MTTQQRREHIADYFATCLITPRLWVERYWKQGVRSVEELASGFDLSPERMRLRLEALGLHEEEGEDSFQAELG
jgi:Zn-dependent peptidase ImmA (M78 family)